MTQSHTPATDMNRSAERTLINWGRFMAMQREMQCIEEARQSPFGIIVGPMLEEALYTKIINHCPKGDA